jgi:hypothetical protein
VLSEGGTSTSTTEYAMMTTAGALQSAGSACKLPSQQNASALPSTWKEAGVETPPPGICARHKQAGPGVAQALPKPKVIHWLQNA